MTIEGSAALAKGWLLSMLVQIEERYPVGTQVEAHISGRQKSPSQARVVGHAIEIGADCTPVPMLIVTANTSTPGARQATVRRTVRLADITERP